jgi:hypothetical protein
MVLLPPNNKSAGYDKSPLFILCSAQPNTRNTELCSWPGDIEERLKQEVRKWCERSGTNGFFARNILSGFKRL